MHHLVFIMLPSSSPSSSSSKPFKSFSSSSSTNPKPNHNSSPSFSSSSSSSSLLCKHSPSATLDLLILILVLFSGIFLLYSYCSYIFTSLSRLLSQFSSFSFSFHFPPLPYICGFLALLVLSFLFVEFCCGPRSRKCEKPGCKGLKNAMEFDLQLQTEDSVKSNGAKEIDKLPWKGGTESNPDYECLRAELRKMAPPNGRAVLLFRARCGCPVAKLEGWGAKRGRRHKKALANVGVSGGGDHR